MDYVWVKITVFDVDEYDFVPVNEVTNFCGTIVDKSEVPSEVIHSLIKEHNESANYHTKLRELLRNEF